MTLLPLPDQRETVIAVGTSVRKSLPVLRAHLESLARQELPPRTKFVPLYVPDFAPDQEDAARYLLQWVNNHGGELIQGVPQNGPDFSDTHGDSHQWTQTAMARVGANKDRILARARDLHADYLFFCDADLLLDRTTVLSLLACERSIVTAVYWTHWSKAATETRQLHAAPQVWLRHPYQLDGRGLEESEFRRRLVARELTRVWGFGACTLLNRRALESGVGFAYLADVPHGPDDGLMAGEDRHFCIHAERRHLDAWADPWPDIFHIYHPDDVGRIAAYEQQFAVPHPAVASLGDLVSLKLRALEPVPVAPGRYQQLPAILARGRLGQLALAPEIEEAVHHLVRGARQVVKVHHPITHPVAHWRGRSRLIELTVIDIKPFGFAPVIDEELYVAPRSGAWHDQVGLLDHQHESIREIGGAHG